MGPVYEKGQIVKVFEYYHDMIVKDSFVGIIIDVKAYDIAGSKQFYIYDVLSFDDSIINTAEEFAIDPYGEPAHERFFN